MIKKLYKKYIANDITLTIFVTILMIFIMYILDSLYYVQNSWSNFFLPSFGITIGTLLSTLLIYRLVIKNKIRIISLVIIGGIGLWLFLVILQDVFFSISNITYILGGFINYIMIGMVLGSIQYLIIKKTRNILLVVAFFLLIIVSSPDWISKIYNNATLIIYFLVIILSAIYIVVYFAKKNNIKKIAFNKIFNKGIILFLVTITIISFLGMYMTFTYMDNVINQINDVKEEQQRIKDLHKKSFFNEPVSSDYIVGMYQADRPVYLKTEVFDLKQYDDNLQITKAQDDFEFFYSYNNVYNDNPYKEDMIRLIYSYNDGEPFPSVEKVSRFYNSYFSKNTGLLKDTTNSSNVAFQQYYFSRFNPSIYKDHKDTYNLYDPQSFTTVSPNSKRFSEIKNLALEITKNKNTTYDKAKSIEQYFINNYKYTLTPGIKDTSDPLAEFILDNKKGFCSYFAASMVEMLENIGIRSRLVGGFYSTGYSDSYNSYLISTKDLHSWVEVFLDGFGWVTFDPTTGNLAEGVSINDLTGGGKDRYDLLKTPLKPVKAIISFDDIFTKKSLNNSGIEVKDYSLDTRKKEIEIKEEEKRHEELRVKTLELKKQEEKRNKERINLIKKVGIVIIIIICILVELFLSLYFYTRYRNRFELRLKNDERKVRSIDINIRKQYIKDYKLDTKLYIESSIVFLNKLKDIDLLSENLILAYKLIDIILYNKKYTKDDIIKLRKIYKEIMTK